jgi:hypothetical protein
MNKNLLIKYLNGLFKDNSKIFSDIFSEKFSDDYFEKVSEIYSDNFSDHILNKLNSFFNNREFIITINNKITYTFKDIYVIDSLQYTYTPYVYETHYTTLDINNHSSRKYHKLLNTIFIHRINSMQSRYTTKVKLNLL